MINLLKKITPSLYLKLQVAISHVQDSLLLIQDRNFVLVLLCYTIISWFWEGSTFLMAAYSVPNIMHPSAGWLAMPVGTLATALPSTPGYVGTFHYFVEVVAKNLGNDSIPSVAFSILIHLMLWLPITLCGAFCFFFWVMNRYYLSFKSQEDKEN